MCSFTFNPQEKIFGRDRQQVYSRLQLSFGRKTFTAENDLVAVNMPTLSLKQTQVIYNFDKL